MNFLLDTRIFLWSISNSGFLSPKATEAIKNQSNEIYVSSVSLWEIAIKVKLKKLDLDTIKTDDLVGYADRMLIWQAVSRNLVLISKDTEFTKFKADGLKLHW